MKGAYATTKRFYDVVSIQAVDDKFTVALDGRTVLTPQGKRFGVPTLSLADAIAAEWKAQEETIDPANMPLTGLANTAIDRVGPERETVVDNLLRFAETDLLCYRAEHPDELVSRQAECWQPLLDWAVETYEATLVTTTGVLPIEQPLDALESLRLAIDDLDDMELTALSSIAAVCGSLIVAMALADGEIDIDTAFDVAQLDETYQSERWGVDSEAEARLKNLRKDLNAAGKFLKLVRK